jgi:hypothetical protein
MGKMLQMKKISKKKERLSFESQARTVRSGWSGCPTQTGVSLGGCLSCTTWRGVGKMGRVTGKEGYNKKRFS